MTSADLYMLHLEDASMIATSYEDGARIDLAFQSGAKVVGHVRRVQANEHGEDWAQWVSETAWVAPRGIPRETGHGFFRTRAEAAAACADVVMLFLPHGRYPEDWARAMERRDDSGRNRLGAT